MIAIASDHGGFSLRQEILKHLDARGIAYRDFGCLDENSCDYSDYADVACAAVLTGEADRAILICGTGIGISIAANKIHGIRAALCGDGFSARYSRLHNDANTLCLGARVTGTGLALDIVDIFLETGFEGGRHANRIAKVMELESRES